MNNIILVLLEKKLVLITYHCRQLFKGCTKVDLAANIYIYEYKI